MAFNIAKMAVQLGVSAAGFASGLRSAKHAFKGFSKNTTRDADSWASKMGSSFASTVAKITILVLSLKRAMRVLLSEFRNLDEARKFAQSIGQAGENATDKLLAFEFAANRVGASSAVARTGLRNLSKSIGEAQLGFGEGTKAIKVLGLDARELGTMLPTEAFMKVAAAMDKLQNSTLKTAAAQKLFGKSGVRMLNLARLRGESIQELIKRHERLAGVMSEGDIAGVEATNDALADLVTAYKGLQRTLMAKISPALFAWLTTAANLISKLREVVARNGEAINKFLIWSLMEAAKLLPGVIIFFQGLWKAVLNLFEAFGALDEIIGAVLSSMGLLNSADNNWATRFSIALAVVGKAIGDLPEIVGYVFTIIKGKLDETAQQMKQTLLGLMRTFTESFFNIGKSFLDNVVRPIINSPIGKHLGISEESILDAQINMVKHRNNMRNFYDEEISNARRYELMFRGVWRTAALRLGDLFKGLPDKIKKQTKEIQDMINAALKEIEKIKKGAADPFKEDPFDPDKDSGGTADRGPRFAGFAELGTQAAASLVAQTESDKEMEIQREQANKLQEAVDALREIVRAVSGRDIYYDPSGVVTR